MRAIETWWMGRRFRSRLEARWAVAFELMGVPWEHEPNGFELDDGSAYLPDFLLHGIVWDGEPHDLYVEVKGHMSKSDHAKVWEFSRHLPLYLVGDVPYGRLTGRPNQWWQADMMQASLVWPYPYSFETVDGSQGGAYLGIDRDGMPRLFREVELRQSSDLMLDVLRIARESRFDHGGRPERTPGYQRTYEEIRRLRGPAGPPL